MKRITFGSTIATLLTICFFIIILSGKNCDSCFSTPTMMIKFFACGLVIFVGSIYFTRLFIKTERFMFTIEGLPLLETNEATEAVPFSSHGKVEAIGNTLLASPFSGTPCVYYHSIKEMWVKRGKSSRWEVIQNDVEFVPFYLVDSRGKLQVDVTNLDNDFSSYGMAPTNRTIPNPKNSEIDCEPVMKHRQYHVPEEGLWGRLGAAKKYRESEFVLRPGIDVFVHGFVSRQNKELVVHESDRNPLIISRKTKDAYIDEFYRGGKLVYLVHVLTGLGFTISLLSADYFLHFNPFIMLLVLVIGNGSIVGSVLFSMYNRIVTLLERAATAKSNIDVELKRRNDLIPTIVTFVKSYAQHEREVQRITTEARVRAAFSDEPQDQDNLIIRSLVDVIENYPKLKAAENFQLLMRTLVDTEERIAYSREFYNRSVRKYNTLIHQFPFVMIAFLLELQSLPFISIAHE